MNIGSNGFFANVKWQSRDADLRNFVILAGQLAVEWLVLLFLYRKDTFLKV